MDIEDTRTYDIEKRLARSELVAIASGVISVIALMTAFMCIVFVFMVANG